MTNLIILRHGRTAWNREEIFRGTEDIPLDDQGRREVACARDRLERDRIDAAYSSPLSRAVETANIVMEPHGGVGTVIHDGLKDLNYGDWQGMSHEQVNS